MNRWLSRERGDTPQRERLQRVYLAVRAAGNGDSPNDFADRWELLRSEAAEAGADRVLSAMTACDLALARGDDALGPPAMQALQAEVADFASDGNRQEMARFLIQGLITDALAAFREADSAAVRRSIEAIRDGSAASGLSAIHTSALAFIAVSADPSLGYSPSAAFQVLMDAAFEAR